MFSESHKKNLDETTGRMMNLIGKGGKNDSESVESSLEQEEQSESQLRETEDHHNKSLSQVCDSLDKSFVSQKARKSKLKKKKADDEVKRAREEQ